MVRGEYTGFSCAQQPQQERRARVGRRGSTVGWLHRVAVTQRGGRHAVSGCTRVACTQAYISIPRSMPSPSLLAQSQDLPKGRTWEHAEEEAPVFPKSQNGQKSGGHPGLRQISTVLSMPPVGVQVQQTTNRDLSVGTQLKNGETFLFVNRMTPEKEQRAASAMPFHAVVRLMWTKPEPT